MSVTHITLPRFVSCTYLTSLLCAYLNCLFDAAQPTCFNFLCTRADVDRLDRQLRTFSATLDAWLIVQKGWMSLEAVFSAPDIQRQLPMETKAFAQVDRTFKDIMRRTHDRPNALQVTNVYAVNALDCLVQVHTVK